MYTVHTGLQQHHRETFHPNILNIIKYLLGRQSQENNDIMGREKYKAQSEAE